MAKYEKVPKALQLYKKRMFFCDKCRKAYVMYTLEDYDDYDHSKDTRLCPKCAPKKSIMEDFWKD